MEQYEVVFRMVDGQELKIQQKDRNAIRVSEALKEELMNKKFLTVQDIDSCNYMNINVDKIVSFIVKPLYRMAVIGSEEEWD